MTVQPRFPREAWIPLLVGLYWLWHAPSHGLPGFLASVFPGALLLGSGVSMLLMPGDNRIAQFAALGGVLGAIFALPAFFVIGFVHGLLLMAASVASYLAAGHHAIRLEPPIPGVPDPQPSAALYGQVALDEALLATMTALSPLPVHGDHARIRGELVHARELYASQGWLEKPESYHVAPPPLEDPTLRSASVRGTAYEHLSFESGYLPHPDEPGRERWQEYTANRTAHAWVLRHDDPSGPWLVCIHGYQMGWPLIDLGAFPPEFFHKRLGLNYAVPTLPLHGLRKVGRRSGDGFIGGEILDTIHAEAQAMWDLRRLLSWIRSQGGGPVGVLGLSLGGYNTALLSCLDEDLACAIAGIPLADFTRAIFRHGPPLFLRDASEHGISEDDVRELLSVVSPLTLQTQVPHEGRYLFGGVADRLVSPDQVRDLWRHWDEPRIEWYQGAHLTFRAHARVRQLLREALRESGLAP